MGNRIIQFIPKGMQRDLSTSKFSPDYAYELKNIRVTSLDKNTTYSLVNEQGTLECNISVKERITNTVYGLIGVPLGKVDTPEGAVIFSRNESTNIDYIYFINGIDSSDIGQLNNLGGILVYKGNLGFDLTKPIEGIYIYESDSIKKVYWTDGINQPRYVNLADNTSVYTDSSFDFVGIFNTQASCTIIKNKISSGNFPAAVIQYVATYYNLYGRQSNIFYQSPLYYTSGDNRGLSPEQNSSDSFTLQFNNLDTSYKYLRLYRITRTSLDGTPSVEMLPDTLVLSSIKIVDNGTNGTTVDPTLLLYLGGTSITSYTLAQKDNTLFLGNISLNKHSIPSTIKTSLQTSITDLSLSYFKDEYSKTTNWVPISDNVYSTYNYTNHLDKNNTISFFKAGECYRVGIQFLYKTGEWSEVCMLKDLPNGTLSNGTITGGLHHTIDVVAETGHPTIFDKVSSVPHIKYILSDTSIISTLSTNNFIGARLVCVYPTYKDRHIICQGVMCPTVYQLKDRVGNSPYSQASWFMRPFYNFDPNTFPTHQETYEDDSDPANPRTVTATINDGYMDSYGGCALSSEHNRRLPLSKIASCEVQSMSEGDIVKMNTTPSIDDCTYYNGANSALPTSSKYYDPYSEFFFTDCSLVTMHSPDIEFDDTLQSMDLSGLNYRTVGQVTVGFNSSDLSIETSSIPYYSQAIGFDKFFNVTSTTYQSIVTQSSWLDTTATDSSHATPSGSDSIIPARWPIYPFHRTGSLNNLNKLTGTAETAGSTRRAMLQHKILSTLRYCDSTDYEITPVGTDYYSGITNVGIFNSNEISNLRLNDSGTGYNYYGNVDKLITCNKTSFLIENNTFNGYKLYSGTSSSVDVPLVYFNPINNINNNYDISTDPISMKYKSTPHAAFKFLNSGGYDYILPQIYTSGGSPVTFNSYTPTAGTYITNVSNLKTMWGKVYTGTKQNYYTSGNTANNGYFVMGELYRSIDPTTLFGGTSDDAVFNNKWIPCSDVVYFNLSTSSITLIGNQGDTYFQRYDCLKTYPFTESDYNSIVDITSFMVETRINIDGRYDRNRGILSNLNTRPTNFNLVNKVYTQTNNFFNYHTLDNNRFDNDNFPNTVTWSSTKTLGEEIDSWTNITMAPVLDLDGDKGKLRSIKRFNNELIAFQDKGVSNILFNSRSAINTVDGVPIELANSAKVDGKRYLTDKYGCQNKWSICESPSGLYFIDDLTKGIYLFNGQLTNISDKFGFHSWINTVSNGVNIWDPKNFNGIVTNYDRVNSDVYFIMRDQCLAFNENLGAFSSFYSYEKTPYLFYINDEVYLLHTNVSNNYNAFKLHGGDYNYFFGTYTPYYTEVIANSPEFADKIFNNIEFRADDYLNDAFVPTSTFDTLSVWNEYQSNMDLPLVYRDNWVSNLKKRFNTWRIQIPRDSFNGRDRMRSQWLFMKLGKNTPNRNKTILHDIILTYFN